MRKRHAETAGFLGGAAAALVFKGLNPDDK
jgi:hypothetical protein